MAIGKILFNPALLHFLVILGVINLAVNIAYLAGLAGSEGVMRAGQVSAIGFVISLVFTAIFEREEAGR